MLCTYGRHSVVVCYLNVVYYVSGLLYTVCQQYLNIWFKPLCVNKNICLPAPKINIRLLAVLRSCGQVLVRPHKTKTYTHTLKTNTRKTLCTELYRACILCNLEHSDTIYDSKVFSQVVNIVSMSRLSLTIFTRCYYKNQLWQQLVSHSCLVRSHIAVGRNVLGKTTDCLLYTLTLPTILRV